MKRAYLGWIVAAPLFLVFSSYSFKGDTQENQLLLKALITNLTRYHYQPQQINDSFSEKVYDTYVESLDPRKLFLIQSDEDMLAQYKDELDDEINSLSFEFFDLSQKVYFSRIKESEAYYQEILAQPFDFTQREYLVLDPDSISYAKDQTELKDYWRKNLKYQVLSNLARKLEIQKDSTQLKDSSFVVRTYEELEKAARETVRDNYEEYFARLNKMNETDLRNDYLNAITTIYDPHTNYFPPKLKQDFDMSMSGNFQGIGATLTERDGFITVAGIIPGSPCYKQGDLSAGDKILKVAQAGEEPVNVVGMRSDEAVLLIRGKKGTEVRLTVKKADGTEMIISIIRDIVQLEETYAKSAILKDERSKNGIGYINLPSFYANFGDANGRRSSTDVAKEIEKLSADRVEGIILDLRDNGGGSLADVVDMAGLFIDKGPIVQVKTRMGSPTILEDENSALNYNGPLVVLVNSFSASASEIFAAAIQDYGRGVVVGDRSTYGKGTVQRFVPLSQNASFGEMKLTIQKYYRINGGTPQLKGVNSDVVLPFYNSYLKLGEKDEPNAMAWDEIDPVNINRWKGITYKLEDIKTKSKERIANSTTFDLIEENAKRLERQSHDIVYPLNLEEYMQKQEKLRKESEKYKKINVEIQGFEANTLAMDQSRVNGDPALGKNFVKWQKSLRSDPYVYESFNIIQDMKNGSTAKK